MRLRLVLLLSIYSMLMACSGPFTRIQAPSISISSLSLLDAQLLEQRYRLQLRIQNPNPYSLPIAGLQYRLYLNGLEFARGVSSQAVTVPAYEERVLNVDMISTIGTLIEQLRQWPDVQHGELRYRLAGEAKLSTRLVPIGFEYHGTIPLNTRLTP